MKLYFEGGARAWVHGIEATDHIADIPEHLVADVLSNPLWRKLTDAEEAVLAAAERAVTSVTPKRTRKGTSNA